MAEYQILSWQEIPSLIEARDGDDVHKEQLSQRFQDLIDLAAMKRELAGSDAYLDHWEKGDKVSRDGGAEAVAKAVAAEIEDRFDEILKAAIPTA